MSHLILKKLPNGKYRLYDKEKEVFRGPSSTDKEAMAAKVEAQDMKEDKAMGEKETPAEDKGEGTNSSKKYCPHCGSKL